MALTETQMSRILALLAELTGFGPAQIRNTVELLQDGATVPFIARYRKERTGELDEVQVRRLEDQFAYLSELEERRSAVLKSIEEQGRLVPELRARIEAARQKTELEDLYLPYRPRRRTKATIARERGLEPLADLIARQHLTSGRPEEAAAPFVDPSRDVADAQSALEGAGHILAEGLSEDAAIRSRVRTLTWEQGLFRSTVHPEAAGRVSKFEMYYDFREPLRAVPSHRMLAMRRGEKEEVLRLAIEAPEDEIMMLLKRRLIRGASIFRPLLEKVAEDAWRRLLAPSIESDLRMEAKKRADEAAIAVFADNLRNLLLMPPAGGIPVLGIDPGLRTGSKIVAVDGTGRLLAHATVYPHAGGAARAEAARKELLGMIARHAPEMIAIGNGTAGREMDLFVKAALREAGHELPVAIVNEAGASVYSASDIAREEFPQLDVSMRGAVSIARRLQDPLAELVKIDPKSIGVGQYQHDVSQSALKKTLDAVVESCVNYVGVDLNTASRALLAYVSGIGETLARNIVSHRDSCGAFMRRRQVLEVSRFGPKAFEQAAGFLRIRGAENPLDNTAVHPENYSLVRKMAADLGVDVARLAADPALVESIDLQRYVGEEVGLPTLRDIAEELKKPGRDPRPRFETAVLREDVTDIRDVREGMVLQGTVTNVTAFGAFVDIGVHQDGLVHVSHLADRFVRDPHEVVGVGQVVKVRVLGVDLQRRRISLSIREASTGTAPRPVEKAAAREQKAPQNSEGKLDLGVLERAGFKVRRQK